MLFTGYPSLGLSRRLAHAGLRLVGWDGGGAAGGAARDPVRAIARAHAAIAEWEGTHSRIYLATAHGLLASALLDAGRASEGLVAAERGIELAETTLDRVYEAELWRVKGELLLLGRNDEAAARDCFARAGVIAASQGATAIVR